MDTKYKICAVVVTFNRKELLINCLNAINEQTYKPHTVIIVDNASTDGTKDLMEFFKIVAHYRSTLNELEKRFQLIEIVRYLIENPDLIGMQNQDLYAKIKEKIQSLNFNILNNNEKVFGKYK